MSNKKKNGFYNPTIGPLGVDEMLEEISSFVNQDLKSFYRLIIGTDSQIKRNNGAKETDFVTAIVIHRKGRGARYFWTKEKVYKIPVLREKIYTETMKSLQTAQEILPLIQMKIPGDKYDLEIHIDVGNNGPTREMIREVVGMVTGNGFKAKTKPESWAASSVADKYT
jgi:hypothetical protein